jgi:hypothetical protein
MSDATASFLGAVLGSGITIIITVVLARWAAAQQTMGAEAAKRRLELLEELSFLVAEIGDHLDMYRGCPIQFTQRDLQVLYNEITRSLAHSRLYFTDAFVKEFDPVVGWAFSTLDGGGGPLADGVYEGIQTKLAEAAAGKHNR